MMFTDAESLLLIKQEPHDRSVLFLLDWTNWEILEAFASMSCIRGSLRNNYKLWQRVGLTFALCGTNNSKGLD